MARRFWRTVGWLLAGTVGWVLIGAVVPCPAQPPADAPGSEEALRPTGQPYWLRVTGDRVNLRSRADKNSVVAAQVDRDMVLQAVGQEYGWHRVRPPAGAFSYVSADYVEQVAPDRGIVAVRSGQLRVRVGSTVTSVDPLRTEVQMLLPRGAEVRILEREGDWLRIQPPEGVFFYISSDFVEPVSAEVAAQLQAASTTRPAVTTAPTTVSALPPPPPVNLSGRWGQRLSLVEATIAAEARKPPLEQSWNPVLEQLRPIAAQREEPAVARLAQEWIKSVERRVADQVAFRAAREVTDRGERDRARFEREMEQVRRVRVAATQPGYAASGQLLESPAAAGAPRYRLVDPVSGEVSAYLELPATAQLVVRDYLGKYVGVRGERAYSEALSANIVRVVSLEIVRWEPPATQPARTTP